MSEANSIAQITDELRSLSTQDKATMKSILDDLLLEERKRMVYLNYPETMQQLIDYTTLEIRGVDAIDN